MTLPGGQKQWVTVIAVLAAVVLYIWWSGMSPEVMSIVATIEHAVGGSKQERAKQLAPYVEQHRGNVPWGCLMAAAEHESAFNPAAANAAGARGVWQIMVQFFRDYGVDDSTAWYHEGSADLATVLDRSTAGACAAANRAHGDVQRYAPELCPDQAGTITEEYAFCLYYAHGEGRGSLQKALAYAASAGGVTLDNLAAARTTYNRIGGYRQVAGLAAWWEANKGDFLS
jgi:hypothetical protein